MNNNSVFENQRELEVLIQENSFAGTAFTIGAGELAVPITYRMLLLLCVGMLGSSVIIDLIPESVKEKVGVQTLSVQIEHGLDKLKDDLMKRVAPKAGGPRV